MSNDNGIIVPRWKLQLVYRTANGPVDVEHFVEELDEIHDIVERGPDWNTLISGRFILVNRSAPLNWTVEEAAAS